jgi:hypothetical protein
MEQIFTLCGKHGSITLARRIPQQIQRRAKKFPLYVQISRACQRWIVHPQSHYHSTMSFYVNSLGLRRLAAKVSHNPNHHFQQHLQDLAIDVFLTCSGLEFVECSGPTRRGKWEGDKVRDLVDALGLDEASSGASDETSKSIFVTKHEILMLRRQMGENQAENLSMEVPCKQD